MDRTQYDIVISHHVFMLAIERRITPDRIEDTTRNGRI